MCLGILFTMVASIHLHNNASANSQITGNFCFLLHFMVVAIGFFYYVEKQLFQVECCDAMQRQPANGVRASICCALSIPHTTAAICGAWIIKESVPWATTEQFPKTTVITIIGGSIRHLETVAYHTFGAVPPVEAKLGQIWLRITPPTSNKIWTEC